MTDEDRLIEAVEGLTLDPGGFDHEAHVRLAYAYLTRHDLFEAMARCRGALRRLAEHHGAHGKYHETVTCALVLLIHERMASARGWLDSAGAGSVASRGASEARSPGPVEARVPAWEDFARANPDLMRWKDGAFFDYYPEAVLHSELARRTFVLPHPARAARSRTPSASVEPAPRAAAAS